MVIKEDQRVWFINFFDKKSIGSGTTKSSSLERSSLILADELHKPIIKKFNKRKVYS